ncbi:hypothetical protein PHYSODRAFT_407198, partial [Phytophthora sojae]
MPLKYYRYALETKLRVVDAARNDRNWEKLAAELGVKLNTARYWVRLNVHGDEPTVKNHVDAACFTMKQLHKEPQYMNTPLNKEKRRDYLVKLQEYQA